MCLKIWTEAWRTNNKHCLSWHTQLVKRCLFKTRQQQRRHRYVSVYFTLRIEKLFWVVKQQNRTVASSVGRIFMLCPYARLCTCHPSVPCLHSDLRPSQIQVCARQVSSQFRNLMQVKIQMEAGERECERDSSTAVLKTSHKSKCIQVSSDSALTQKNTDRCKWGYTKKCSGIWGVRAANRANRPTLMLQVYNIQNVII